MWALAVFAGRVGHAGPVRGGKMGVRQSPRYQGVRPAPSRVSRSVGSGPLWVSGQYRTCCSVQSAHCRVICASPARYAWGQGDDVRPAGVIE